MSIKKEVAHSVQRTVSVVGVLAVVGLIIFVGWILYAGMIKPVVNPTKTMAQKAAQINNPTYSPQPHFGGCANMRVYEYYRKEKQ